jgi:hypothetical protein
LLVGCLEFPASGGRPAADNVRAPPTGREDTAELELEGPDMGVDIGASSRPAGVAGADDQGRRAGSGGCRRRFGQVRHW